MPALAIRKSAPTTRGIPASSRRLTCSLPPTHKSTSLRGRAPRATACASLQKSMERDATGQAPPEDRINMRFDLQPTLKGDLLELRPLRAEDYPALYSAAADPLVWEQHPSNDRYKEEVFKVFFREAME